MYIYICMSLGTWTHRVRIRARGSGFMVSASWVHAGPGEGTAGSRV